MKHSVFCLAALVFAQCVGAAKLSLTNEFAVISFDDLGRIVSVVERDSSRELLLKPTPFAGIGKTLGGGYVGSVKMEAKEGLLVFRFPDDAGYVSLRAEKFFGGFSFTVVDLYAPEMKSLYLGRMAPAPRRWIGRRSNMASDDKSALCVRSYDIASDMQASRQLLQVRFDADAAKGKRFGVVGSPRAKMRDALKAMTIVSGRPHSTAGGAWALESDAARGSYLNANVSMDTIDDWIDVVERGGFDVLHFRERWYACRGQYPLNAKDWPGGIADMKAAVEKIHKAGYRAGLHTLTGCIDPKDPWVAGEENGELLDWESYTLAEDLTSEATELTVCEPPKFRHDTVFTYSGNGNAIRVGNEIVQYSSYTATPPYRYCGLKRGAFGTKVATHRKGEKASYLQQRYIAFYPNPDSSLADKLADAIASIYNTCFFDQIYCDGAEGMFSPYAVAMMRDKIMSRCIAGGDRPCLNEDSIGCPAHSWWYHSRVGAWDSCFWAPKRFHDFHVERINSDVPRQRDFLEIQMGWWAPHAGSIHFSGHKLDDMEYYASRNAGLDASMSVAGIHISKDRPLKFHMSNLLTVLGWYERARRAQAFRPEVQKAFNCNGAEFRLRQDAKSGEWMISPVKMKSQRAVSKYSERVTLEAEELSQMLLRVEALYAGERNGEVRVLTEGVAATDLAITSANSNIVARAEDSTNEEAKRVFRLSAENCSDKVRGAWAKYSANFKPYRKLGKCIVMRFKVKGDGSGALLNVQPESPREYGQTFAEHYVKLDFTGWREFEMPLRERDSAEYANYEWPYKGYGAVFHRILNMDNICALNFYLNEIPAKGATSVEVSDVEFVRQRQLKTMRHAVKVNGNVVPIPFEMFSGWYAELEGDVWTLYSAEGDQLRRAKAGSPVPMLQAGVNEIHYRAQTLDSSQFRSEISVFAVGKARSTFVPFRSLPAQSRKQLSYEAMLPQMYAPSKGFDELAPVVVRPGETAKVELTLYGPMPACTVRVGNSSDALPVIAKGSHRKFVLSGEHRGICPVAVVFDKDEAEACGRFEFVKRYQK